MDLNLILSALLRLRTDGLRLSKRRLGSACISLLVIKLVELKMQASVVIDAQRLFQLCDGFPSLSLESVNLAEQCSRQKSAIPCAARSHDQVGLGFGILMTLDENLTQNVACIGIGRVLRQRGFQV